MTFMTILKKTNNYYMDKWISVKERLPEEEDCICIVCADEGHNQFSRAWAFFDIGTDASGNRINFFREFYGDALISNVTHWMPLPDLPSAEDKK